MYNKISSIILNSGKANGLSDVFIAQPDSLKENLAGKIFIIAEIGGKKTDGRKVFDFIVESLNDNYYNDEKILLRNKIEGLKIENIFEAAVSKTNKNLEEFLAEEKIKLNLNATNLTIGVIYENKLYFSGFGKNRALLIYRHNDVYEIINVEANASDSSDANESREPASFKAPALFSSVISGEIPTGSYFVFAGEALLEYISNKDLINIITKLPPIVASEQIKNILAKINTFIPFLGIIIKNTIGLDNQDTREEVEENLSAHSSISSLNYTEQKTERMLAPAGLISFSKIYKGAKQAVKNLRPAAKPGPRKIYRAEEGEKNSAAVVDVGKIKSLNIARSDSFLIKEKIVFKKKPNIFLQRAKNLFFGIFSIFSPRIWANFNFNIRALLGRLSSKNRLLFISLAAVVVIFLLSLGITTWTKKMQAAKNNYNNLVATIQEKQNAIDSFLLYGNEDGANTALIDARALLSYLPKEKKDQAATYSDLEAKLNVLADKVQKVVRVAAAEKVNDLSGLQVSNIVWADGRMLAAGGKTIYSIIPQSASSTRFEVTGAENLSNPQFDRKSIVYYWDNNKLAQINLKNNQTSEVAFTSEFNADGLTSYKIFGSSLYVIAKNKNQIYRFSLGKNGYTLKTDWLKSEVDLSGATDLYIDGSIYILNSDGKVSKFYLNKPADYSAVAPSPVMSAANKLIVGTKYVYIFEASSKRLVVLAIKDGHLMNQYQLDSLVQPKDFAVDENSKAAYFLDGEAVYRVVLNQ